MICFKLIKRRQSVAFIVIDWCTKALNVMFISMDLEVITIDTEMVPFVIVFIAKATLSVFQP